MIDTKMIQKYVADKDEIKKDEEAIKARKQKLKDDADKIYSMLAAAGAGKVNVGSATVSPRRQIRASSRGMSALVEALKEAGVDALVSETVNANTLTGYVNQFDPDRIMSAEELREELPEELRDRVNIYEQLTLSVTRT